MSKKSPQKSFYFGPPKKGYISKYGCNWLAGSAPIMIELACFREKMAKRWPVKNDPVTPFHHFKNFAKAVWPEADGVDRATGRKIVYPVKFVWHSWADRMLKAFCENDYVAVAGCGGAGKSELAAMWLVVCFLSDPANTLGLCTSTTLSSSKKKLWAKIVQYWTPLEKLGFPGKLADSFGVIRYVVDGKAVKGDMAGIALIAAEKKKEKEAVGKLIGMHQEIIIFVGDELGELSEAITEAAFNNLARGCRRFQFIGISNPSSYYDPFGKFAKPKNDWTSIDVEDDEWETDRGICIHLDTLKNPRIMGDARCWWMDSEETIQKEMERHGGKSSSFWRMFRGFWCPTGAIEKIYTEIEIIGSKSNTKAVWLDDKKTPACFLDPSYTNGGDRTIAYFGTVGTNVEGVQTLEYDEYLQFHEDVTNKELTRTQQVIKWWRHECEKRGIAPRHAGYDATGAGGPFGDVVSIMWSKEVLGLQFGGKATEDAVSAFDPTPACDRYVNKVTQIWYSMKEPMRNGQIRGLRDELIQEMCVRMKEEEKGLQLRIKVMPKAQMKSEIGQSPDLSDAAMGLAALCKERLGFDSGRVTLDKNPHNTHGSAGRLGFKQLFRKLSSVYDAPPESQIGAIVQGGYQ